jgi:hypothetical protein
VRRPRDGKSPSGSAAAPFIPAPAPEPRRGSRGQAARTRGPARDQL